MTIYDSYNNVLLETNVSDKSSLYCGLDNKDRLTLHFTLDRHVEIPIGSWCNFEGNRYEVMSDADVKMNHTENYDYTVVLSSYFALTSRYKVRNMVDRRLKFDLVAKPHEHLQMIVDNLNARGRGWSVGSCIDSVEKLVSYNHTNCEEALVNIANVFNTEIEVVGKIISLKKVEYFKDNPLALSYGKGNGFRPGIQRTSIDGGLPVDRLYVQGGSRNISLKEYGSSELHLPKNLSFAFDGNKFNREDGFNKTYAKSFTTDADGMSVAVDGMTGGREDSLDLSDVYPSRVGKVTGVVFIFKGTEYNAPESSWTADDWNEVQIDIVDNTIPESLDFNECLMENNEPLTVVFQSGMLAGREFNANYLSDKKRFQLVKQEFDGQPMPQDSFIPKVEDSYAVCNVYLPASYISDATTYSGAEYDILRAASKYLYEKCVSEFSFAGEIDGMWAKKNWDTIGPRIRIGSYVSFTHESMFPEEPALVRIVGITQYVNNPHYPKIELSNSVGVSTVSSRINKIENQDAHVSELYEDAKRYAKRRYTDIKQTIKMLSDAFDSYSEGINPITVETMLAVVGDKSLQYFFTQSIDSDVPSSLEYVYDPETSVFNVSEAFIKHMTIGIDSISPVHSNDEYLRWHVAAYASESLEKDSGYYLYAKVSMDSQQGTFLLSKESIKLEEDGYYNLLVGILNAEADGDRTFASMYGFTEILPGQITTDTIKSADGNTWLDLLRGILHLNNAAGVSGVKTEEKGDKSIAAWFGGLMEDKELDEGAENPAKSVIRHDGTGYFAGGNIRWDEEGGAEFGGGDFKILPYGSIVFGKNIKISAESDETLGTILTFMANFKDWFYLTEDGKSIGTKYNLFSELEISANGLHAGSGGGTGGSSTLAGLMDVTLSSPASGNILVYNGTHWVNKPQSELVPDIDLSDYYTRTEVDTKLGVYIKTIDADTKYAPLSGFNTLKSDFDALNAALNDDVSGKINTWNEIVDFVNEYSESDDLATLINNRLLTSTFNTFLSDRFNPLETKVGTHTNQISGLTSRMVAAETAISTNTTAIQAVDLKVTNLGNHMTEVDETIIAIQTQTDGINERLVDVETWKETTDTTIQNLSTQVSTNKTNIEKILGWFQLDSSGNLYTTYNFYSTKEISANGLGQGTGGSGGSGIIKSVLGVSALGTSLTEDNTAVFNAFATNKVYNDLVALTDRVNNLTTVTSAVGWKGEITSGKKIGTLTINGLENYLYVPDKLSAFTDDVVSGKYLPSTGGTLTNDNNVLNLCGTTNSYIYYRLGSTNKASSGYYENFAFIANETTGARIGIADDGTPQYHTDSHRANVYTLLHSGNYNSYAPTLTGTGASGKWGISVTKGLYLNDNREKNEAPYANGDYPTRRISAHFKQKAHIGISDTGYAAMLHISPWSDSSGGAEHQLIFSDDGSVRHRYGLTSWSNWKTIAFTDSNVASADVIATTYANQSINVGAESRVRLISFTSSDSTDLGAPKQYVSGLSVMSNYVGWQLVSGASQWRNDDFYIRKIADNGAYLDWRIIAFTDSNVASATKLATARTIWGQSFDGTGNITGYLFGKTKNFIIYGYDGANDYNVLDADSNNSHLHLGYGSAPKGHNTSVYGNNIYVCSGTSRATRMIVNSSGNVGIGTTSPSYKLDVAGSVRVGDNVDGGMLLRFNMDRSWDFYQQGTGADSTLALKSTTNSKNFVIQDETGGYIARFFAASTNSSVQIYTPLNVNGSVKVNADMYAAGTFYFATDSDYGGYLAANPNGWFGIYSANKGNWQATNIYCYPNGEVGLPHGAKIEGKNSDGDTALRVEGTQYALHFGIGSGNVNRGIYDITNGGWWIYRDASTLTRISGGISTSTGAFSGAVTISNTLKISTSVGQGQAVTITDSSALSSFGRAFTALYPNAVKGAHIDMYVGVANSAKNGGYLGFYYDAAASDNNRISLGLYSKDNILNINGKGHVLINTTVDSGYELEVNGKAYTNNIYGGNSIYAKNYLFMNYDNSGIYLSTNAISWHSGNSYKSSLLEFTQTSVKISQPLSAGATTLSSLTVNGGAVITSSAKINEVTYGYGTITFAGNIQINPTASGARVYLNTSTYGLTCTGGALSVGYIGEKRGYKFYVRSGNAYVEGNIVADGEVSANVLNTSSDIRFKNRISDVVLDLDTMADAPMFRFTWKNRKDDRVYIGSSAQYWKGTNARELVSRGCDDFHRLDYATLGVLMGRSLAFEIRELKREIVKLKEENRRLRYGN